MQEKITMLTSSNLPAGEPEIKSMIMKKILLFILLLSAISVKAQNEFNTWYFGFGAGLDFNAGAPVVLTNGAIATFEGSASISDASGLLQFYTDGVSVWNRNHLTMPNGNFNILGGSSSTQSANILPVVGSPGQYYIVTTPNAGSNTGFHYSIVDMSLQGGFGDVTTLNTWLMDSVVEGNTVVPHANGTDYWIVTHKFGTADYYSFLVNSSGIQPPAVSTTGNFIGAIDVYDAIGYIKPSPCGNKIAYANTGGNFFDLSDFDNSTGVLSNTIQLPSSNTTTIGCYGLEFSPDGSRLYGGVNGTGEIFQFDLNAGSTAAIIASQTLIGIGSGSNLGALQLGPDQKIYVGRYTFGYLGVINDPDILGVACNYVDSGLFLNGVNTCWGLPGHFGNVWCNLTPVAIFNAPNHICPGTCTNFINLSHNASTFLWTFAGANPSTSTDTDPTNICYNTPGTYAVSLVASNAGGSDTLTLNNYITVYPYPAPQGISQSGDTLFANSGAISYQWYLSGNLIPGATDYFYVAQQGGDYNVVANDANGCEVEAAIFDVVADVLAIGSNALQFEIVPNPVNETATLKFKSLTGKSVEISIYNMIGEKVMGTQSEINSRHEGVTVDVQVLAKGVYWIEVTCENKTYRAEMMKK
ncbi:hypothetical protein BH11BAC1_BH11BAC1_09570 [soil metagenome]